VTASAFAVIPILGNVDYTQAAIFGVLLAGVRAGFKALGEYMVGQHGDPQAPENLPTYQG